MSRTQKTPRQRAEEALGVAERKVARLEAVLHQHESIIREVEKGLARARLRREYLAANPDLPNPGQVEAEVQIQAATPGGASS